MEYNVIFQPSGRRGKVAEGKTLLTASHELGVDIEAPCGAHKVCGKCKVKIETGFFEKFGIDSQMDHLSPLTEEEKKLLKEDEIANNYRLACAAEIKGDVLVFVPEESRKADQVVLDTGKERTFKLDPAVKSYYVEMPPATLEDHRDDLRRLQDALKEQFGLENLSIDYFVLRELPNILRDGDWKVTASVLYDREIIDVRPGFVQKWYGIGIDVGTTTVAAYLCDLSTGEMLVKDGMMNPQVRYGEDVLSRITYAMMHEDGREKLHQAIIEGINTLAQRMTEKVGLTPNDVLEITLVFNTAMHHCLLNLEPKYMGRAPFAPAISAPYDVKARDLGIKINKAANIHVLPVEAGFVGPDNVAVLIAEEPYKQDDEIRLIIDIGTNGEIDLGNRKKLLSTSCATGPALEGAQIKFGMRAAPGAIEKIKIDPETLECTYKVIGDDKWHGRGSKGNAKGICGSGIIDMVAEVFKAGIINKTGRFNTKLKTDRIRKDENGKPEYVLVFAEDSGIGKDITVTQGDIRAVQLAKAALYVGAKMLMRHLGVEKVDRVTLAGAFGSFIDKESSMVIGMFPDCDLEKVHAVGNAAGDGAQAALLDKNKRIEARDVAASVQFVETAVEPDFQERFAEAMAFPHAVDPFPSIQHILDRIPGYK
ncbi:ferredoxin [Thermincola ferriacetica]|uniref:Ferredoxin n=1 Tax=Thermincola ferriacetica TaxID=281456 RepID=A0A0L6W0N0_9FIRM|nr:ASKHA domain-containing protein [Thermincola ferriacetica]KNZ69142.1 ferredoxin [Thermincola ferriacetica]